MTPNIYYFWSQQTTSIFFNFGVNKRPQIFTDSEPFIHGPTPASSRPSAGRGLPCARRQPTLSAQIDPNPSGRPSGHTSRKENKASKEGREINPNPRRGPRSGARSDGAIGTAGGGGARGSSPSLRRKAGPERAAAGGLSRRQTPCPTDSA